MADILIRGLEMPKGCKSCKLSSDDHCNATGQWLFSTDLLRSGFNWKTCRLPDCPLIELPEHGDLIDRDAVIDGEADIISSDCYYAEFGFSRDMLRCMPVIVPAEREETE